MKKIEGLTHKAIDKLAQEKPEEEVQNFLRDQFPGLSPDETKILARPIPPGRQRAVGKIVNRLEEQAQKKAVGELDDYIKDMLPGLNAGERGEFIPMLARPIPPKRKQEETPIAELTQKALDSLARKKRIGEMQDFLQTQFPDLSPDETKILARPIPPGRRRAVGKIVRQLEEQAQEKSVGELEGFLDEKLPGLSRENRVEVLTELTRPIPPRKPKTGKKSRG